jgi:Rps23 Pro-64 3,4-dihydroxylase Tpa1-like proline 4-hydroxylase
MKQKKAQLQIQEMAFVIVAILFFFILVGLFAFSIFYKNLHESATEIAEQKTISTIHYLSGTAEFSCPGTKSNCVDEDKLLAMLNRTYYENFWSFSSLKVIKKSGFTKSESQLIKCNIQNYPNCDFYEIHNKKAKNERVTSSFVALCREEYENNYNYNKCEIAKFIAGTEIR